MNIIFDNLCIVHLVGGFFCENAVYLYDLTKKKNMKFKPIAIFAAFSCILAGCDQTSESEFESDGKYIECEIDTTIPDSYAGQTARDSDTPGTDPDIYWEAGRFDNLVKVAFNGNSADVTTSYQGVDIYKMGADVVLDFITPGGSDAEVVVSGKTGNGSLKVYSENRLKLTLDGAEITSAKGPAVNMQCSDRVFVHLPDGKTSVLTDASVYADDIFYRSSEAGYFEVCNGCLNICAPAVFSGRGVLQVKGMRCDAVYSAGSMMVRPGVTMVIPDAAGDGINVSAGIDGSGDMGCFRMDGGLLYARVSSDGGSALRVWSDVDVKGGELQLYCTGHGFFAEEELDLLCPAAVTAGGVMTVLAGTVMAKANGAGGAAMRLGCFHLAGGSVTAAASGALYKYHNLRSYASGMTVDGDITVDGGALNTCSVTDGEQAEAICSVGAYTQNKGEVYAYAREGALVCGSVVINGGELFSYSHNSSAVSSGSGIDINGGVVVAQAFKYAFGTASSSSSFKLTGGTVLGIFNVSSLPKSYAQPYMYLNKVPANKDSYVYASKDGVNALWAYRVPRSSASLSVMFSSAGLPDEGQYHCYRSTSYGGGTMLNRILYDGGTASGASDLGAMSLTKPAN